MSLDPEPGAVVAQRYRLERLLGEGGMGAVWAATHLVTHKAVALKLLKNAAQGDSTVRRFMREARAASAVRHPNVVQVHDVLEHEGQPVMVMDLLAGESLASRLARDGRIPLDELAKILLPVVSAIGTAHAAGIVHRDIKPDNVFLHQREDGEMEPKVLDFGIAKLSAPEGAAAATAHLTSTGAVMGTPYYMAPEQVFGEKDLDHRADIWAIGVVAYECLAGRRPFDGDNVGQLFKAVVQGKVEPLEAVAPHLPQDVTAAIGRMLVRDRDERASDLRELYAILKRYSSVEAVSFGSAKRAALEQSGAGSAISVDGVVPPTTETVRLPVSRPRWLPLGAFVLVAGAALGVWALGAGRSNDAAAPVEPSASVSVELAAPSAPAPPVAIPEPAASDAAPAPSASAALRKPPAPPRPSPVPPRSAPALASAPAPPATAAPTRQPGTPVEAVPF